MAKSIKRACRTQCIQTQFPSKPTDPRNATEKALVEIWQRLLGLDQVGIYDNFFELGGHSLLAFRVIAGIKKELNLEVTIRDLFIHPVIADLSNFLTSENKESIKSLIPLRATGSKPPVYLICGVGGTVLIFKDLVAMLDKDQPVYGLQQSSASDELNNFPSTIEEIAHNYIQEILVDNPHGPYALAGHCLGGIIALEMAKQLKAKNKEVAMVSMFDTVPVIEANTPLENTMSAKTKLSYITSVISKVILKIKFEWFLLRNHPKQAFQYKLRSAKLLWLNPATVEEEDINRFNIISAKFQKAVDQYVLTPYDGHLIVFYAKEHYYFVDRVNDIQFRKISISDEVWKSWKFFASSLELHEVDGEHLAMFNRNNAEKLASLFQSQLNRSS